MRQFLFTATLFTLIGMAAGFVGIMLQAEASPTPRAAALANSGTKIAVFNMAAVMKDYERARIKVYVLNKEKKKMSAELVPLRDNYIKLQQDIQSQQDSPTKDQMQMQLTDLAREIENKNREISRELNEKASVIIIELYNEIKTVLDKTAEKHGYQIVFSYPDAANAEDLKNPSLKELKLKPPAAQPFYLDKQVDLTDEVIQALNAHYSAPYMLKSLNFLARFHLSQHR
jgi:Skp family chaperone for outer membrane proteins